MTWLNLEGHDALVERFRRSLQRGRLGSAYLFAGADGIGKFTFASQLARSLLCTGSPAASLQPCGECPACRQCLAGTHPDVMVVRKPEDRNVIPIEAFVGPRERRMREGLCPWIAMKPSQGSRRIAIIDEADYLAEEGANSLLKTLEEPPPRSLLILVAANPSGQLPTIRSRCQLVHFEPLPREMIPVILARLGEDLDHAQVEWISRVSQGSIAIARRWLDPSIADFRQSWYGRLVDPEADPLRIVADATEFVEGAGKEAPARRNRLDLLFDMTADLFRQTMRAKVGASIDADPPLQHGVTTLIETWRHDAEALGACIQRCIAAGQRIEAYAQPQTILESWLDDLARITRDGAYAVPASFSA